MSERLQLVWVSAAEGQIFQDKINDMRKTLANIKQNEIKRGMLFFSEREKKHAEKLEKVRTRLKVRIKVEA